MSYSFLVTDATLTSDNSLHFRKNLLERMRKLIMTTDILIRYEKRRNDVKKMKI